MDLRRENAILRERLDAALAVAREREERIQDLVSALRSLPAAWTRQLEAAMSQRAPETSGQERDAIDASWAQVLVGPQPVGEIAEGGPPEAERADPGEMQRAGAAWDEARRTRDRLEADRLGPRSPVRPA